MDKCRVTGLAVVAAAAVFADTVDPSHEVKWRADVTDGMYNDAANWTGGVVPAWKAQNLGPGKVATFVRNAETGVVTATFKSSGVVIYLR